MTRLQKTRLLLSSLYLAFGPSVWFASFRLGPFKNAILVLLCVLSIPLFFSQKKSTYFVFLLASLFMGLSFYINPTSGDITILVFGIIENFIFFVLGYSLLNKVDDINKYTGIVLFFPVIGCLIALLNFLTGFPNWIAPDQLANYENLSDYTMYPLWATGFSWNRNGWGCTLALLLPLCFLLPKTNKYALLSYLTILASIFVCGNRNGLVAAVLALSLLIIKYRRMKNSLINIKVLVFIIFVGLVLFGSSFIINSLRLDSGDLSAGRIDQYLLIPDMIRKMGFWGMGHNGTYSYLVRHGCGNHLLHNTYFKIIIEYGWLIGIVMLWIVCNSLKRVYKALSSNDKNQVVPALIIVSGLSVGLFEPMTIFGVYGGYSIWWFALGYLSKVQGSHS